MLRIVLITLGVAIGIAAAIYLSAQRELEAGVGEG